METVAAARVSQRHQRSYSLRSVSAFMKLTLRNLNLCRQSCGQNLSLPKWLIYPTWLYHDLLSKANAERCDFSSIITVDSSTGVLLLIFFAVRFTPKLSYYLKHWKEKKKWFLLYFHWLNTRYVCNGANGSSTIIA